MDWPLSALRYEMAGSATASSPYSLDPFSGLRTGMDNPPVTAYSSGIRQRRRGAMSGVHDMGGRPNDNPIEQAEHTFADWERRTHALVGVLREKRLINTDELRRGIESIPAQEYESLSYYERWSASLETLLVEKGVLTAEEIERRAEALREKWG